MNTAAGMEWDGILRFNPSEWPAGVLEWMDPRVIRVVADIRDALPADHRMTPSPLERAHVRHEVSGSRHSTHERARLSDATDIYMDWKHVWRAWQEAQRHPSAGGLGIYTDMLWAGQLRRRAMLHIDTRPGRLVWVAWREDQHDPMKYTYLTSDPIGFHRIVAGRARGE